VGKQRENDAIAQTLGETPRERVANSNFLPNDESSGHSGGLLPPGELSGTSKAKHCPIPLLP
jgi:hypothetical protein